MKVLLRQTTFETVSTECMQKMTHKRVCMGVLESKSSVKFSGISQLSVRKHVVSQLTVKILINSQLPGKPHPDPLITQRTDLAAKIKKLASFKIINKSSM